MHHHCREDILKDLDLAKSDTVACHSCHHATRIGRFPNNTILFLLGALSVFGTQLINSLIHSLYHHVSHFFLDHCSCCACNHGVGSHRAMLGVFHGGNLGQIQSSAKATKSALVSAGASNFRCSYNDDARNSSTFSVEQ